MVRKSTRISGPFDKTVHKTEWTCAAKIAERMNMVIRDKNIPFRGFWEILNWL